VKRKANRYRLPDFRALEAFERYDELARVVVEADEQGVLCPLPRTAGEVRSDPSVPTRTHTIRTRLFLLGYLGKDNGSPRIDARLRKAIREFQGQAGLTVDGWVGDETWTALEELVSFESPSNIPRWFTGKDPDPVLVRAAELRLHVLGLLDARHPRKRKKVTVALERFALLADLLGLADETPPSGFSTQTLSLLFDQDGLTERLAGLDEELVLRTPRRVRAVDARRWAQRFVTCVAKVELWLLGYEVRPGFEKRSPVQQAMAKFWIDAGQDDDAARRSAATIGAPFFRQLLETQREGDRGADREGVDLLYRTIVEASPKQQRAVWKRIRSIGSRIWDGIKRVWRWFKATLKRGIRAAVGWAGNLARLAYRYATDVFAAVDAVVKAGVESVAFVSQAQMPGSDPRHLVIRRDSDFDYDLFYNRFHDPQITGALLLEFSVQCRRFAVAARVMGLLLESVVETARRSALGGWFGFVLSLIRIRGRLIEMRRAIARGRELVTYDASLG
jgi:hypothetical protein